MSSYSIIDVDTHDTFTSNGRSYIDAAAPAFVWGREVLMFHGFVHSPCMGEILWVSEVQIRFAPPPSPVFALSP
jgi:hypothetical protein